MAKWHIWRWHVLNLFRYILCSEKSRITLREGGFSIRIKQMNMFHTWTSDQHAWYTKVNSLPFIWMHWNYIPVSGHASEHAAVGQGFACCTRMMKHTCWALWILNVLGSRTQVSDTTVLNNCYCTTERPALHFLHHLSSLKASHMTKGDVNKTGK